MTKRLLSISTLVLALATSANAGFNTTNFQDVGPTSPNSYYDAFAYNSGSGQWNGLQDPTASYPHGQFTSGGNTFNNSYNYYAGYGGYWSGWSVSNQTTSSVTPYVNQATTPDYNYQYISAAGSGANGAGSPFGVAYAGGAGTSTSPSAAVVNLAPGSTPFSVQVTNTLYDVYSMTYGDSFATPFAPGNSFTLTVYGYTGLNGGGTELANTVSLTLASDTTAGGLSILESWQTLNLSSLAGAQSLVFGLFSNDDDSFGDAIPSYIDVDNLVTFTPSIVPEPSSLFLCLSGIGIGSLVLGRIRSRKGSPLKRELS
jgi:hypothetical protein